MSFDVFVISEETVVTSMIPEMIFSFPFRLQ
jgi:hypothetical protein